MRVRRVAAAELTMFCEKIMTSR